MFQVFSCCKDAGVFHIIGSCILAFFCSTRGYKSTSLSLMAFIVVGGLSTPGSRIVFSNADERTQATGPIQLTEKRFEVMSSDCDHVVHKIYC